jgi:hypothetical protein
MYSNAGSEWKLGSGGGALGSRERGAMMRLHFRSWGLVTGRSVQQGRGESQQLITDTDSRDRHFRDQSCGKQGRRRGSTKELRK